MNREKEAEKIKEDIKDLEKRIKNLGEESASDLREKVSEYPQMLKEKGHNAAEKTKETAIRADKYAHEHPWTVMAIGVGVGLISGLMIALSNKKDK